MIVPLTIIHAAPVEDDGIHTFFATDGRSCYVVRTNTLDGARALDAAISSGVLVPCSCFLENAPRFTFMWERPDSDSDRKGVKK